jgi:chromosome segregation ATPase
MPPEAPVLERSTLRDVEAAFDPLREKHRDLQTFMASQLERLELQAGQVEQRERDLGEQAEALTRERRALDEEWAHFDQLVETARAHALEVRQEKQRLDSLLAQQSDDGSRAEITRLHDVLDQTADERNALEEELAASQRKLGQLADVSIELAEARTELERLRSETTRADAAVAVEWQRKLANVELERDRLAAELQKLRQNEADLLRQRDEERRRYRDERTEWLSELRSMRRSLSSPHVEPLESHVSPRTERPPASKSSHDVPAAAKSHDLPLDDMLDQFEAVKRDSARHRAPKH